MSVHDASPLQDFHHFVGEQIRAGQAAELSPEEAVVLWRERRETVEAIREGLSDAEAGRVKPLGEFLRDFENRHRISSHG